MKVKIIDGVYGFRDESGTIQPVSPRDEAIELPDSEAARLISLRVAQECVVTPSTYIPASKESIDNPPPLEAPGSEEKEPPANDDAVPDSVAYNIDMTANELKEIMEANGVQVKARMTKGEMVAALDAAFAEAEGIDDGEVPPDLSGDDIVS